MWGVPYLVPLMPRMAAGSEVGARKKAEHRTKTANQPRPFIVIPPPSPKPGSLRLSSENNWVKYKSVYIDHNNRRVYIASEVSGELRSRLRVSRSPACKESDAPAQCSIFTTDFRSYSTVFFVNHKWSQGTSFSPFT
jgi:hypothetical protein